MDRSGREIRVGKSRKIDEFRPFRNFEKLVFGEGHGDVQKQDGQRGLKVVRESQQCKTSSGKMIWKAHLASAVAIIPPNLSLGKTEYATRSRCKGPGLASKFLIFNS